MTQSVKWIDGNPDWICLAEPEGFLLGRVRQVKGYARVLCEASVLQEGRLVFRGFYSNHVAAKKAVQDFAFSQEQVRHAEECPCQACVTKRYEWRVNHLTQADEDELAAIFQAEQTGRG